MKWLPPPKIKIYEALSCIADGRVHIEGNTAKVFSSSGGKFYVVTYDKSQNAIMANDNGSYWKGYLGYPTIAYLMLIGCLNYSSQYADALKGIAWKDTNTRFSNDFEKTLEYVHELLHKRGINLEKFLEEIDLIHEKILSLNLSQLGEKALPPVGY